MSFQSARFFVFLIVCLFLYYAVPKLWKNLFLLLASWFFYSCAGTAYFVLLVVVSAISYVVADVIGRAKTKAVQTTMLVLGLVVLLGNLCFFKYYDWFGRQLAIAASHLGSAYIPPDYGLAVPLGISFYTFVLSGYLIDVYQRKREPERNFVKLALFASFFPLVSSGPVERSTGLLPQFDRPAPFQYDVFCQGASRILWGFFKKFVVADTLAVVVNRVFLDVTVHTGPYLLLAALFYSYQLYCDFSGYSDIAIGMARLFGFDVIENFRRPFAARSFSDLWRRWHISLTSWFRQYLYFPLGGSRKGTIRTYLNILLIFLVSGIWHGTGLNFAIWGLLNGVYMVLGRASGNRRAVLARRNPLYRWAWLKALCQIGIVYLLFTSCIVFFRAENLTQALWFYSRLATGWTDLFHPMAVLNGLRNMGVGYATGVPVLIGVLMVEWGEWRAEKEGCSVGAWICRRPFAQKMAIYYLLLLALAFWGKLGTSSFIYFQF